MVNYGVPKHYAGSMVSDRCPLSYLFVFSDSSPNFPMFLDIFCVLLNKMFDLLETNTGNVYN